MALTLAISRREKELTERGVCLRVGDVLGLGECGGVKVKRSQPSAARSAAIGLYSAGCALAVAPGDRLSSDFAH
jgi:hypothetical protein